jgi:prolyl oligopeptidase PreP (S9A serine peptidase family)
MMAKRQAMGYDVRYFENIEGGHGGGADRHRVGAAGVAHLVDAVQGI